MEYKIMFDSISKMNIAKMNKTIEMNKIVTDIKTIESDVVKMIKVIRVLLLREMACSLEFTTTLSGDKLFFTRDGGYTLGEDYPESEDESQMVQVEIDLKEVAEDRCTVWLSVPQEHLLSCNGDRYYERHVVMNRDWTTIKTRITELSQEKHTCRCDSCQRTFNGKEEVKAPEPEELPIATFATKIARYD